MNVNERKRHRWYQRTRSAVMIFTKQAAHVFSVTGSSGSKHEGGGGGGGVLVESETVQGFDVKVKPAASHRSSLCADGF